MILFAVAKVPWSDLAPLANSEAIVEFLALGFLVTLESTALFLASVSLSLDYLQNCFKLPFVMWDFQADDVAKLLWNLAQKN